jgi:hypothetical protein
MSSRVGVRGIVLALGMTAAVLSGTVCSVDNAGLSNTSGQAGAGGAAGSAGHAGSTGSGGTGGSLAGTGGSPAGTGGSSTGGVAGAGSGGTVATGGKQGSGGIVGTGGNAGQPGTGGVAGSGGSSATGGGSGSGGDLGTGGIGGAGGMAGTGGSAGQPGTGGVAGGGGAGGESATGGESGGSGTGGAAGSGGTAGTGGVGGSNGGHGGGHTPDCSYYPSGTSSMVPTDDKLHCYWAHGNEVGWDSAEAICENEGGTLVTILSSTENMLVLHIATQAGLFNFNVPVAIGATDGKAANDQTGAGDYAWVTGEAWGYVNWHQGEPSGTCTGCVGPNGGLGCSCDHWLMLANDGTWYDRNESTARPFVCEAFAR